MRQVDGETAMREEGGKLGENDEVVREINDKRHSDKKGGRVK
jgi:hypothetical protein